MNIDDLGSMQNFCNVKNNIKCYDLTSDQMMLVGMREKWKGNEPLITYICKCK